MQALLEAGADKSAGAMDDMSALHFAAQQGHTEVVKVLVNAGVYPLLIKAMDTSVSPALVPLKPKHRWPHLQA